MLIKLLFSKISVTYDIVICHNYIGKFVLLISIGVLLYNQMLFMIRVFFKFKAMIFKSEG